MRTQVHVGKFIADELEALNLTASQLAQNLLVDVEMIDDLLNENADLTAELALRLGQYLGTGHEVWMNLQGIYDIDVARQRMGNQLQQISPINS